jgi:hypothetical protein
VLTLALDLRFIKGLNVKRQTLSRVIMNVSRSIATGVTVETVSPQELLQVITNASSQNPLLVQQSSKRLKEMFEMFGTFDALHEIAAQTQMPLHIRQQAIIQFKNAALAHWKSRK